MSTSVLAPQPLFEKRELHSPSLWLCLGHRMTPQMRTLRSASPLAPTAPWPAPPPCTRCGHRGGSGLFSRRRIWTIFSPADVPSHTATVSPAHPVSSVPKDHAGSCWRNSGTHLALGPSNNASLTRGELPRASYPGLRIHTLLKFFIHTPFS